MSRPKKSLPPSKEKRITIRVTDALYETLLNDAKASNLSLAEYVRSLVRQRRVTVKPEIVYNNPRILKALGDIGKIGSNLHQIAHHLNAGGTFSATLYDQLQDLMAQLYRMRMEIEEMVGEYRGDS